MSESGISRGVGAAAHPRADRAEVERVREIFKTFAHAVSILKLFPSTHENVRRFRDDLFARIERFLGGERPLEFGIKEDVFVFEGEVVYRDEHIQKSLPYFFYKDGMKKLSFFPGLTRLELEDFLALIREVSLLPSEAGDIVDALWQKDLEHIRFFAPNDYLASRITSGTKMPLNLEIDLKTLTEGRISLDPVDSEDVRTDALGASPDTGDDLGDLRSGPIPVPDDSEALAALLRAERRISLERDFVDMVTELLRLEDRPGPFRETLDYLAKLNEQFVRSAHLSSAVLLSREMEALAVDLRPTHPQKAAALDGLQERLKSPGLLDILRVQARQGLLGDWESLFSFLEILGFPSLPLAGELVEKADDRAFLARAVEYFARMGRSDPAALAALADPRKPILAQTVIAALAGIPDPRIESHLLAFRGHAHKGVRTALIRALRAIPGREPRRALLEFLQDSSDAVRLLAAKALLRDPDPDTVPALIAAISDAGFRGRRAEEKAAVLEILGATRTPEAAVCLRRLVAKRALRVGAAAAETSLAAVRALERMGTPDALEALRAGGRRRHRAIRAACREAAARLSRGGRDAGRAVP